MHCSELGTIYLLAFSQSVCVCQACGFKPGLPSIDLNVTIHNAWQLDLRLDFWHFLGGLLVLMLCINDCELVVNLSDLMLCTRIVFFVLVCVATHHSTVIMANPFRPGWRNAFVTASMNFLSRNGNVYQPMVCLYLVLLSHVLNLSCLFQHKRW